ncbi:transcriptional regulator BetI [compost metagenome]
MVAAKAGFSKGIIAYYFKTKKQLIMDSLKAFLGSYKMKINSSITKDMQPLEMVKTVIDVSLPRLDNESHTMINVSDLEGIDKIHLPQEKIARIFVQFISKAANDEDLKNIVGEIYLEDIEGISSLINYAKRTYQIDELDEKRAAYTLLAMIYGLSFFRVTQFMLPGDKDNREIAFEFVDQLFKVE